MEKKRLLVWSDSVVAGTGFGTVSKHVLQNLQQSGLFNIDHLAINHDGKFIDLPYQIVPARLNNSNDPYGNQMFVEAFSSGKYDYVWIMNDTFVVEEVAKKLPSLIQQMKSAKRKIPKIVFYFPVDCKIAEDWATMLRVADVPVAYCKFGYEKAVEVIPNVSKKLKIINHGVDFSEFQQIDETNRKALRAKLFNILDDDKFLWVQVNRNSPRKDIARSILAFSEFKKKYPNTMLYLHTAAHDTTIDLIDAVRDLGLDPTQDVIFPKNFSAAKPFPVSLLNMFYNCGDAFLTTTLGEGWGLTHLEAAATGLPIVCPNNTCFPEQLDNGNRGYLYKTAEKIWIDNSGYRPWARLDDIVSVMEECYLNTIASRRTEGVTKHKEMKKEMQKYLETIQWKTIGKQWVAIFKQLENLESSNVDISIGEEL